MNNLPKSAIAPLTIAQKLAAADNLTEPVFAALIESKPWLVELLWFLQSVSMQPGGLEKFALDLIEEFKPQFGPATLREDSKTLTIEQREELWGGLHAGRKAELIPFRSWSLNADIDWQEEQDREIKRWAEYGHYPKPMPGNEQSRFRAALLKIPVRVFIEAARNNPARFSDTLAKIAPRVFRDCCLEAARTELSGHLRSICEGPARWIDGAPWYCEKLIDVLFEAMAAHASRVELQLARTEVVSLAFDRLNYAWQEKCLVKIEGDARTGKSEAIKAWCSMHPGRARLVATPSRPSMRALTFAVADSLGIPVGPKTDTSDLQDQVQFIIRHSRLFFIFDEAHFLLPTSYGRNTNPARLDWVRTEIVDRDLPVALVCTPQAFKHSVARFQKWTGYNFAQFLGRIMLNVTLPNELGEADLLAVTKIQGPDIPEKFHGFIVARAMQSEGYLKSIEAVCRLARYVARRGGHAAVTLADVELAASEVMPSTPAPAQERPATARPRPIAEKRTRPVAAPAAAPTMDVPPRAIAPTLEAPARENTPAMKPVLTYGH